MAVKGYEVDADDLHQITAFPTETSGKWWCKSCVYISIYLDLSTVVQTVLTDFIRRHHGRILYCGWSDASNSRSDRLNCLMLWLQYAAQTSELL